MVTCNVCRNNLLAEEIHPPFRYVCDKCWQDMTIGINGYEIDKEQLY